jgi:hypothetical protein
MWTDGALVLYDIDRVHHVVVINDLPTQTGERLFDGEYTVVADG